MYETWAHPTESRGRFLRLPILECPHILESLSRSAVAAPMRAFNAVQMRPSSLSIFFVGTFEHEFSNKNLQPQKNPWLSHSAQDIFEN